MSERERKAVLFQPRCGSWTCPACGEINKRLWTARAWHGAEKLQNSNNSVNFLTLTSHESLDAAGSLAVWPDAWKKLKLRVVYYSGKFEYLMIPERHRDDRLHVHAIVTATLSGRDWKDFARASGLGYMVDCEPARSPGGCAYYVAKYTTKSLQYLEWPKHFRRVRVSRGWPKLPPMPELEGWAWEMLKRDDALAFEVRKLELAGYRVEVLDHDAAWRYANETP